MFNVKKKKGTEINNVDVRVGSPPPSKNKRQSSLAMEGLSLPPRGHPGSQSTGGRCEVTGCQQSAASD